MDLKNFLECPLPKIQIDIEKIAINMKENTSGEIHIKNVGGGTLCGDVISNTDCIVIENDNFFGNDIVIKYDIVPSIYSSGDFIKSELIIVSNGGQIYIPVFINISNFDYLKCGDDKVYTVKEFYQYYLKNYIEAIRVFYSYEFILWLKNIKYEQIEVVEEFLKDANKQRAIDNFFVFSKIKEKATISIKQTKFSYKYFHTDDENVIVGNVCIYLKGSGYFEDVISLDRNVDFITLDKTKITNKDFQDGVFNLEFKIQKDKLTNFFEKVKILLNKCQESVIIEISKKNPIEIIFEKTYFSTVDKGVLKILNNTNKDVVVEIVPKDTYIFFKAKQYLVSKYLEIDFDIKLSGFLKAQMEFLKRTSMQSEILVKVMFKDSSYSMQKNIFIGSSLV